MCAYFIIRRVIILHTIPPAMNEKEKVFGGIFTLGQMLWIIAGVVLGILLSLVLYSIIGVVGLIGIIFGALAGFFMAFYKIKEMSVMTYLRRKHKFKKKNKKFINRRDGLFFDFTPGSDETLY